MRFLADESLEFKIVGFLRQQGHDVLSVTEIAPSSTDDQVLDFANREARILITNDKDFGELVFLQAKAKVGVMLVRVLSESIKIKISRIADAISSKGDLLFHSFTVVRLSPVPSKVEGCLKGPSGLELDHRHCFMLSYGWVERNGGVLMQPERPV